MAYKVKKLNKEQQRIYAINHESRKTKIAYLSQIGLFKEKALNEMPSKQIDELTEVAVRIKMGELKPY